MGRAIHEAVPDEEKAMIQLEDAKLAALPTHRLLALLNSARAKASAIQCRLIPTDNQALNRLELTEEQGVEAIRPYAQNIARIKMVLMGRPHEKKAHKGREKPRGK